MITRISNVFREWLGWCPNHPRRSVPMANKNLWYLILIVCVVSISAMVLAVTGTHWDAVWIFAKDSSGTQEFLKRVEVPPLVTSMFFTEGTGSGAAAELPGGSYLMVIQHPGPDGTFDVILDGDWVTGPPASAPGMTGSLRFFRMSGPGSLQRQDAYEALVYSLQSPPAFTSPATSPTG